MPTQEERQKPTQEMQTGPETPEQAETRVADEAQEGKESAAAAALAGAETADGARENEQAKIDAIVADIDRLVSAGQFDLNEGLYLQNQHRNQEVARAITAAHEAVGWSAEALTQIEDKVALLQQERKEGETVKSFADKVAALKFNGPLTRSDRHRLETGIKGRDLAGVISVLRDTKEIGPKELDELSALSGTNTERLLVLVDQRLEELERQADNATY